MGTIRRRVALAATIALFASLAACGDDPPDSAEPGGVGSGGDPDSPVLVIGHEGGFTTPDDAYRTLPDLVVYADGRVVSMGAQIMIYPGPALPPLFEAQLSSDGLATVVDAIREAGLTDDAPDYGQPPIADAGQTVVVVDVDGRRVEHRAEALGFDDPSLSAEQREARATLEQFVATARDLDGLVGAELGEESLFEPDRFRLWVRADLDDLPAPEPGEPGLREREWTIDAVELVETRCLAVADVDAVELFELLSDADRLTVFESRGELWSVVARPVLPHEEVCGDDVGSGPAGG